TVLAACLSLPLLAGMATPAGAAAPVITTVGGGPGGGPARELGQSPQAVAVQGPLVYVSDRFHQVVRVLDTRTGLMRAVAGTGERQQTAPSSFVGDGGPATATNIDPAGVAADPDGNVYIAEPAEARVRRVDPSGTITTYAGTGTKGYAGDGGPARSALLSSPLGLVLDPAGNLYIADVDTATVRRVSPSGVITTVAGTGTPGFGGDGGPATLAQLNTPVALAWDSAGRLFVADEGNHRVRRIDEQGRVTTVAGTDSGGPEVYLYPAPATATPLWGPTDVSVDALGNLYVTDRARVHRVDTSGTIETLYGPGSLPCPDYCSSEGQAARGFPFNEIVDAAVGSTGQLFVADRSKVFLIDAQGVINRVAGSGEQISSADGIAATSAELGDPWALARDQSGNLYVADPNEHRVRRISPEGTITTVAGTQGSNLSQADGIPATSARLDPYGIAVGPDGDLYIADVGSNRVRKVDAQGIITTVAGTNEQRPFVDGGLAVEEPLPGVRSVAFDSAGNLYIGGDLTVWKVRPDGRLFRFAGGNFEGYIGDGGPATAASMGYPRVFVGPDDTVYLADNVFGAVRKVDASGTISAVYGGDRPASVAVDGAGNVFVADRDRLVRRAPSGALTTVAGGGDRLGEGGAPTDARLDPFDVLLEPDGSLLVGDWAFHRVRRISGVATALPPAVALQAQYSVWAQPASTPLDGVGTWIATANDPAAGAGQRAAAYLYALGFNFASSTARGAVGLASTPSGKYAVFSIVRPDGTGTSAVMPFSWSANRFYFPFVYQVSPGTWGAWVYDHQTA
ncbi:MAG: hypothetical protein LC792_21365, partial [Actinobacteria bacterium]|nr:hypothetical protein [Actinomycetota bacterium]